MELVVSILVISVLMAIAYQRLERMVEDVERVTFEGTVKNIQAQLTLQVANWYAEQIEVEKDQFSEINPLELVQHKPSNYMGEVHFSQLSDHPAERWYYVKDKHWLVYKAKRYSQLVNEFEQPDLLIYRLVTKFEHPGRNRGLALEATLRPIHRFKWQAD